jgi:hypothetical protein
VSINCITDIKMKKVQFILVLKLRSGRKINFILSTRECIDPTRTSDWRRIKNILKQGYVDTELYKNLKAWGDNASVESVISGKFVEFNNNRRHIHGVLNQAV